MKEGFMEAQSEPKFKTKRSQITKYCKALQRFGKNFPENLIIMNLEIPRKYEKF